MKRKPKTTKGNVIAREREARALEMRKAGAGYKKIGAELGISTVGAYKCVKRVLDKIAKVAEEDANEIKRLEIERLDALLLGLWRKAATGHEGAVDRVLRIMVRRSELLGLDAPKTQKQEHSGPDGEPLKQCFIIGGKKIEF